MVIVLVGELVGVAEGVAVGGSQYPKSASFISSPESNPMIIGSLAVVSVYPGGNVDSSTSIQ